VQRIVRVSALTALLGVLLSVHALGATPGPNSYNAALGVGDLQCQAWSRERQQKIRGEADREWVLGYISGFNVNEGPIAILGPEGDAVVARLDEYCLDHPNLNVMSVTTKLIVAIYAERLRLLKTALPSPVR